MRTTPDTIAAPALEIERLVAVVNPHSTNAPAAKRQLADILQSRPQLDRLLLETTPDRSTNIAQLRENLRANDLLIIAGGDGTVSESITTLITTSLPRHSIPVLPLWGGNGNDLASTLNGRRYRAQPHKILDDAQTVAIHPIRSRFIDDEFGIRQRIGVCYMGIGSTALGAQKLNEENYRHHFWYQQAVVRQIMELRALGGSALRAPSFTIHDNSGVHRLVERTIANGPRMAKFARFPVALGSRELFVADVEAGRLDTVLSWLGSLALQPIVRPVPGHYVRSGESLEFTIGTSPVLAQVDAEAELLLPGSQVRIRQAHQKFYALSTNSLTAPRHPL